jgi:hypothetical protein
MFLLNLIQKKQILRKWRKAKKRKRTIHLKICNVVQTLQDMEYRGIRYVVLRWPEEVPLTIEEEWLFSGDIDLLTDVDTNTIPELANIVSRRPGPVVCDVYSIGGRGGTSYLGMPYYPPVLAECILTNRCRHANGFYVPEPMMAFRSLAFHLVYHKGPLSGIPTGCEIETDSSQKRNYRRYIEDLGNTLCVGIEIPYSLLKLHHYLKQCKWNMPYDLLERWPNKNPWHKYLLQRENNLLRPWAEQLPGLLVFFIREDATTPDKLDFIIKELSGKFQILRIDVLSTDQIEQVIRFVRGGNWIQGKDLKMVRPVIAIISYDHTPIPIDQSDNLKKAGYPLVKNQNVFIKHHIRHALNRNSPSNKEIFGIHGSDNEFEAQHMLRAIYGERVDEMNSFFLAELKR